MRNLIDVSSCFTVENEDVYAALNLDASVVTLTVYYDAVVDNVPTEYENGHIFYQGGFELYELNQEDIYLEDDDTGRRYACSDRVYALIEQDVITHACENAE
jgi:hypothetical protein